MDKYKDYIARLQSERMMLDILFALDEIRNILKTKYNDEQIIDNKTVEKILEATTPEKKRKGKNGGDK